MLISVHFSPRWWGDHPNFLTNENKRYMLKLDEVMLIESIIQKKL